MNLQSTFNLVAQLTDHLVPTLGVLGALIVLFFISKIKPYLNYVKLLANADTPEGRVELAKYIARQTGGKKIDTDALWEAFLPAAEALFKLHQTRTNNNKEDAVISETNNRVSTETSAIATHVTTLESKFQTK